MVFGSARLLESADAKAKLLLAEEVIAASAQDPEKKRAVTIAIMKSGGTKCSN
ncbi:MAG: hypothetical protein H0W49_06665 [Nitrospirales bacterium]|nr:hypothetical protein [Nitrospirales bacterium]